MPYHRVGYWEAILLEIVSFLWDFAPFRLMGARFSRSLPKCRESCTLADHPFIHEEKPQL